MSVDMYPGPRLGRLGIFFHFRFGWPSGNDGENIATNIAWANLLENLQRACSDVPAPTLERLVAQEWIPASHVRAFQSEWQALSDRMASTPASEFVRVAWPSESHGGSVVSDADGRVLIQPSTSEFDTLLRETEEWAHSEGQSSFHVQSLRDLFWYQFKMVPEVVQRCLAQRRPLVLG